MNRLLPLRSRRAYGLSAKHALLALAAAIWLVTPVQATSGDAPVPQLPASKRIDLPDYLGHGLTHYLTLAVGREPSLSGVQARIEAASAAGRQAQSLTAGPAAVSIGELNDRTGSDFGRVEQELSVSVPLWLPQQRAARASEAESMLAATLAQARYGELQLAGRLRESWWLVASARADAELASAHLAAMRALAQDLDRRLKAGEVARADANSALGQQLAAEALTFAAENNRQQIELEFEQLTGVAPPLELAPESAVWPRAKGDAWLEQHPEFQLAAATAAHAQTALGVADRTRRDAPELELGAVRERAAAGQAFDRALMLRVRIPLASGSAWQRQTATARAVLLEAEANLRQTRLKLARELAQAKRGSQQADQLTTLSEHRVELARDNLALAEKAYALGETGLASLMLASAAALDARTALEHQRIARAAAVSRLHQASGILP